MDNKKLLDVMAYVWSRSPQLHSYTEIVNTQISAFNDHPEDASRAELDSNLLSLFENFVCDFLTEIGKCIAECVLISMYSSYTAKGNITQLDIRLEFGEDECNIAYEYTLGGADNESPA